MQKTMTSQLQLNQFKNTNYHLHLQRKLPMFLQTKVWPHFVSYRLQNQVHLLWWLLRITSRNIDTLVIIGREIGHSLLIAWPRESMSFPINVFWCSKCMYIIFRRDARGAYHLFGGGVIHKTRFMFQRYVSWTHVRMIEFHTLFPFTTHDYVPYDSCQLV